MNYKIFVILFLISLFSCLSFNLLNLKIQNENKVISANSIPKWRNDNKYTISEFTIWNPDNEFYINPAINLLKFGELQMTPRVGKGSYFRRVPGYSLLYFSLFQVLGESYVLYGLVAFQVLLYCLTSFCIYLLVKRLSNQLTASILTGLYLIVPWFHSYTFFTITEGITPSLMLFFLYFFLSGVHSLGYRRKVLHYFLASLFISIAVLTRPTNGLGIILLLIALISEFKKLSVNRLSRLLFVCGLIPILMFGAWTYRNYKISGELVILEKAFHPESLDRQKPEWKGLFEFAKSWGEDGAHFNSYNMPLFIGAIEGDIDDQFVVNTLKAWPEYVVIHFGYQRLFDIVKRYQMVTYDQRRYYQQTVAMPSYYLEEQILVEEEFDKLKQEFRHAFPLKFYFFTPLKYLKDIVIHSNTAHLAVFQRQNINSEAINLFRYGLVFLHVLLYLTVFLNLYLLRRSIFQLWSFALIPLAYLLFFSFYFQQIEQRYMFPVLPWLFVGMFKPISLLVDFWRSTRYFPEFLNPRVATTITPSHNN